MPTLTPGIEMNLNKRERRVEKMILKQLEHDSLSNLRYKFIKVPSQRDVNTLETPRNGIVSPRRNLDSLGSQTYRDALRERANECLQAMSANGPIRGLQPYKQGSGGGGFTVDSCTGLLVPPKIRSFNSPK
jgi:hypothetical protein